MTIPRLELAAAVLAVRMDLMLKTELQIVLKDSVFWTDSTSADSGWAKVDLQSSFRFSSWRSVGALDPSGKEHTYVCHETASIRR